jgi:hypothetical protein
MAIASSDVNGIPDAASLDTTSLKSRDHRACGSSAGLTSPSATA